MPREKVVPRLSPRPRVRHATSASGSARSRSCPIQSDQPRRVAHIVGGGEIVVEADLVGQIADPAFDRERLAHGIVAEHAGLPIRDVAQAQQHQDRGGLAGAVRAEQAENLPARDRERNALDDGGPVVALGELLRLDDVVAHRRPNHTTAPNMTSSAPPMMPMPTMPHMRGGGDRDAERLRRSFPRAAAPARWRRSRRRSPWRAA